MSKTNHLRDALHGLSWLCTGLLAAGSVPALAECDAEPTGRHAVFFHPDGTSAGHWDVARLLVAGPDGALNWNRLPEVTTYRGHMLDSLTATSNGGAVVHATGTRVHRASFGLDERGQEVVAADGTTRTLMQKAIECGLATALVQTGSLIEPGTAAFVAKVENRYADREAIAAQIIASEVDFLLGAGERWLLPAGEQGRFIEGVRSDGRNLIEEAEDAGYVVVYTRDELLALPDDVERVLGVFAGEDTFHDQTEEALAEQGLPAFLASAPSVAEMTGFVLERLSTHPAGSFAVIEEEGTDNMCNKMNASGCLEALRRADVAIGVILEFIDREPGAFMVTTSDSSAGGMQINEVDSDTAPVPAAARGSKAALDGVDGTQTRPFLSAPDAQGRRFPFAVVWAVGDDTGSGVIARAAGHDAAELLPSEGIANTDIYSMLHRTLFGAVPPSPNAPASPDPSR